MIEWLQNVKFDEVQKRIKKDREGSRGIKKFQEKSITFKKDKKASWG